MGGGDCPIDNELAIAPFPASTADVPSSSHPPGSPLHHIHTLKCHLKIKHKKHKPCKKLKLNHKHKHTDILFGHQFHPHHSHCNSHSPPHHHHHELVHKKHHHHHGNLYSHGKHPFAAHPMTIHIGHNVLQQSWNHKFDKEFKVSVLVIVLRGNPAYGYTGEVHRITRHPAPWASTEKIVMYVQGRRDGVDF